MYKIFLIINTFFLSLVTVNLNKSYGWGFSKNDNHLQPYIGSYSKEIEDTNSFYVGDPNENKVYFTFDCGYDNGNLIEILDILDKYQIDATFFITGDFLNRFSDLVIEIKNRGHIIGNHTWSHKNITTLKKETLVNDIKKLENKYYELTNEDIDLYFRPPAGVFNKESLNIIKEMGYSTLFWSIAYKDWETNSQKNIDYAVNSVVNNLHNGAIILLHTVSNTNVKALPVIIEKIKNANYEIASINNLFIKEKDFIF